MVSIITDSLIKTHHISVYWDIVNQLPSNFCFMFSLCNWVNLRLYLLTDWKSGVNHVYYVHIFASSSMTSDTMNSSSSPSPSTCCVTGIGGWWEDDGLVNQGSSSVTDVDRRGLSSSTSQFDDDDDKAGIMFAMLSPLKAAVNSRALGVYLCPPFPRTKENRFFSKKRKGKGMFVICWLSWDEEKYLCIKVQVQYCITSMQSWFIFEVQRYFIPASVHLLWTSRMLFTLMAIPCWQGGLRPDLVQWMDNYEI